MDGVGEEFLTPHNCRLFQQNRPMADIRRSFRIATFRPRSTTASREPYGAHSSLLQIDGLVAAVLVELGAPYFVRALVLGWTEADGRPDTHIEVTQGF